MPFHWVSNTFEITPRNTPSATRVERGEERRRLRLEDAHHRQAEADEQRDPRPGREVDVLRHDAVADGGGRVGRLRPAERAAGDARSGTGRTSWRTRRWRSCARRASSAAGRRSPRRGRARPGRPSRLRLPSRWSRTASDSARGWASCPLCRAPDGSLQRTAAHRATRYAPTRTRHPWPRSRPSLGCADAAPGGSARPCSSSRRTDVPRSCSAARAGRRRVHLRGARVRRRQRRRHRLGARRRRPTPSSARRIAVGGGPKRWPPRPTGSGST